MGGTYTRSLWGFWVNVDMVLSALGGVCSVVLDVIALSSSDLDNVRMDMQGERERREMDYIPAWSGLSRFRGPPLPKSPIRPPFTVYKPVESDLICIERIPAVSTDVTDRYGRVTLQPCQHSA